MTDIDKASEKPEMVEARTEGKTDLYALAGMILLVGVTHLASKYIFDGGLVMLLLASVFLGWFVYNQSIEWRMLSRRAVADAGFESSGFIHRWVSRGILTKLFTVCLSVVLSGSFMLHANQISWYIWVFIYLDAFVIIALLRLTRRKVTVQCKPKYSHIIGRQYVFWLNLSLLMVLICIAGMFIEVDDLRGFSPIESFTTAWTPIWHDNASSILAAWGGLIAGLDAMLLNIMQQISQQDFSIFEKVAGWIVFFVIQSLYLWVIQSAMLGTLVVAEQMKSWPDLMLGNSRASKLGWGTFYLLILIWLGLSLGVDSQEQAHKSFPLNVSSLSPPKRMMIDPCENITTQEATKSGATVDKQILQEKSQYKGDVDSMIDANVDEVFQHAMTGVDTYLDWYFTMSGEWQRLATVVVGDVGILMKEKMKQMVEDESGFSTAITSAQAGISNYATEQFTQASQRIISVARHQVDIHPCSVDQSVDVALPSLSRDLERITLVTSVTATAGAAIVMTTGASIATKLAASAGSKVAAKVLAKAAAKTATKTVGGMAGAGAGALAGLSCGPYAPVCSTALAVVGFIGIDALFVEADELMNRDDMRHEMIEGLNKNSEEIKAQLKANYHQAGDSFFTQVSEKSHALFIPARDGV